MSFGGGINFAELPEVLDGGCEKELIMSAGRSS